MGGDGARSADGPAAEAPFGFEPPGTEGLGFAKGTVFASGPLAGVEKNAVIAGGLAVLCTAALIGAIYAVFELLAAGLG